MYDDFHATLRKDSARLPVAAHFTALAHRQAQNHHQSCSTTLQKVCITFPQAAVRRINSRALAARSLFALDRGFPKLIPNRCE